MTKESLECMVSDCTDYNHGNVDIDQLHERLMKIKDHEIARLASMLQKAYGKDLAAKWNQDLEDKGLQAIYDSGDCRQNMVAIIKDWVNGIKTVEKL